ncbi:hypothetical protein AX16_004045 [Volvariella volvacea WC 439]|nr:hypothetical protein AX16_004045 [Volvariella volvacea WC 439]
MSGAGEVLTDAHHKAEQHPYQRKRHFLASGRFLFSLGLFLGTVFALSALGPSDIYDIQAQLALILGEFGIRLPELPGMDFSRVEVEWQKLRSNIPEVWKFSNDGREFEVGEAMKARGLTASHPIVLIPGVISTGLESWSTSPDYRAFFRQKLWGGFNMLTQVTFNREKWISAMMLDPDTGLDPPDVKVRAAEGIDAASSFIQGYWIWSKIVENLAVVNYDTNNLFLAPYDWRVSYYNLEERDGYFSKLKTTIEGLKRHFIGVTGAWFALRLYVLLRLYKYFFKWVEAPEYGGGGPTWVEDHIEAYISIAGTHLVCAKAMAAFLSGEMKDTVQINPAGAYVLERFFSRRERQRLFRSWAGSASMWVKGGNDVWGNDTHAPDDEANANYTYGDLIGFRQSFAAASARVNALGGGGNMTADEASTWILQHTPPAFQRMIATNYSFGIERDENVLTRNDLDHRKWTNPLEVRLPQAPSMKIYCVYGHGKETERSYWYAIGEETTSSVQDGSDNRPVIESTPVCTDQASGDCVDADTALSRPLSSWIDAEYTDESIIPRVRNGVKVGEGDGTVSLLSLGAMCVEGWKRPRWNPARIKITTVELPHRPNPNIPRGGANTSDHVDILGSTGLNEIILKVATGVGHEIEDSFVSNIREYAKRIKWD